MSESQNIITQLRNGEGKSILQFLRDGVIADGIQIGPEQDDEKLNRLISKVDYFLVGLKQEQLEEAIELGRKLRENKNLTTFNRRPGVERL